MEDQRKEFMGIALKLAKEAKDISFPNPMVGAVLVKNNEIIGKGNTKEPGNNHAEISAINDAKKNFPSSSEEKIKGSSLYVTLEPCSKQGRTPACTEEIIKNSIKEVIIGSSDPSQDGLKVLSNAGIKTQIGVLKDQTDDHHKGFLSRVERKRPYVRCKIACSLDGGVAFLNGESKWITSEKSRIDSHDLRKKSDAIITGIGTVIADDPKMTVRSKEVKKQPIVCVLDTKLKSKGTEKIYQRDSESFIFTKTNHKTINNKNIKIVEIDSKEGDINLRDTLEYLAKEGISELMLESGPSLVSSFIKENLIDEFIFYIAPKLMGKNKYKFLDLTPEIKELELKVIETQYIGNDLKLEVINQRS